MSGHDFTQGGSGLNFTSAGESLLGGELGQQWLTSGTADPAGWTFSSAATGSRLYSDPTEDVPFRSALLSTGTDPDSSAQLVTLPLTYLTDGQMLVVEWMLRTGAAITGDGDLTYSGRVEFSDAAAWDLSVGVVAAPTVSPFFLLRVESSAGTSTVLTNVTIAAATTYRVRLEVTGPDADPGPGTDWRASLFIDGVRVATATFDDPPPDALRLAHSIGNGSDDPNANYSVSVGPVASTWTL